MKRYLTFLLIALIFSCAPNDQEEISYLAPDSLVELIPDSLCQEGGLYDNEDEYLNGEDNRCATGAGMAFLGLLFLCFVTISFFSCLLFIAFKEIWQRIILSFIVFTFYFYVTGRSFELSFVLFTCNVIIIIVLMIFLWIMKRFTILVGKAFKAIRNK